MTSGRVGGALHDPPAQLARFGIFEFDFSVRELRRRGHPIVLQQQPMLVLAYLIESAGRLVTREELQEHLWPSGTFVDFEFGLNAAVNRLRRTLSDSASAPLYIETVPKQGYRFIAPVEFVSLQTDRPAIPVDLPTPLPALSEAASAERVLSGVVTQQTRWLPRWFRLQFVAGIAIGLLVGVVLPIALYRSSLSATVAPQHLYRYAIRLPENHGIQSLAISPAGDQIVYEALSNGVTRLYRRYLDEEESRAIPGTEDAHAPFFSPDGQGLGFYTPGQLKVVNGSGIHVLASMSPTFDAWNAVWAGDGFVYFNSKVGESLGIWRVPAAGGRPESVLRTAVSSRGVNYVFINQVLAGRHPQMIYSIAGGPLHRSLGLLDLTTHGTKELLIQGSGGQFLADGHLVYFWNGSLFAVPYDPRRERFTGSPVEMVKDIAPYIWIRGKASLSNNGTLVYVRSTELQQNQLKWVDRSGKETPVGLPPAPYEQALMSPDGHKLALVRRDAQSRWTVWSYDLQARAWTRLLEAAVPRPRVIWSPDSASVVVGSERDNSDFVNLVRIPIAAPQARERLTEQPDFGQFPQAWSAKANALLFMEGVHPGTNGDIMVLPLTGQRRPRPLVATPGWDRSAAFSPDERWLVYETGPLGKTDVFAQPYNAQTFQTAGPAVQISHGGGHDPLWSPDGTEIYYVDPDQNLMHLGFTGRAPVGPPRELIHHFSPGLRRLVDACLLNSSGRPLPSHAPYGESPWPLARNRGCP
jgi:DNA-binding winged helix-turn-helix (wHTH) protein/Tol biopolymer transport system component